MPPRHRTSRRITIPHKNIRRALIAAVMATTVADKIMAAAETVAGEADGTVAVAAVVVAAPKVVAICPHQNTPRRKVSVRTIRADMIRAGTNHASTTHADATPAAIPVDTISAGNNREALIIAAPRVRASLRRRLPLHRVKSPSCFPVNPLRNIAIARRRGPRRLHPF